MSYKNTLSFARAMRANPTPAEVKFWEKVRKKRLFGFKFYRQYIIQYAIFQGVKKFFIADFYCHTKRTIIELDGSVHQSQIPYDTVREIVLLDMGYSILRFSNQQVLENWDSVESTIISHLNL